MKILKMIIIGLGVLFVAIQFYRPAHENPPTDETQTTFAAMNVPEEARKILERSCNDCHSYNTNWIWYSNFQPALSFMADHVEDGRRHLNFSAWKTFEAKKQKKRLKEICDEISDKSMPLPSYLWLHGDARLSDDDVKILCDWSLGEAEKIPFEVEK